jgi:serine/threonine protein kinase
VILGLGWMFSTDMWSMGCIIYELAVGRLLYDTHENHEHLHMLERTLGRLPAEWNAGRVREDCRAFFSTTTGQLRPISDPKSIARIQRTRPVRDVLQDELLRDLVLQCLQYDRQRRMTARQMAAHPYVVKYFPESLQSPLHPRNRQNMQPSPIA